MRSDVLAIECDSAPQIHVATRIKQNGRLKEMNLLQMRLSSHKAQESYSCLGIGAKRQVPRPGQPRRPLRVPRNRKRDLKWSAGQANSDQKLKRAYF